MSIKSWICPGCHRDFIVDGESTRDTCPWCHAAVEEKSGTLQVAAKTEKPAEAAGVSASPEGYAGSSGASGSGTNSAGTQSWWPFEYSS
ncbi:MAG TPA: hypothetical protein VNL16_05495 [Chloroflexota bacterium]|nr:hypothetical protein [Chloroflexota bacterium]